jgi:Heavy-metal resistance
MLGFFVGTVCLFGLIKTLWRGGYGRSRCGGRYDAMECGSRDSWRHSHYRHSHHEGRGGWNDPSTRWMLRSLFERLDTTPGQEKVIMQALDQLRGRGREARDAMHATGPDAARAFRGERFDEAAMADAFAKHDAALESMQKALFEALAKSHEALDERQRHVVADMLERGLDGWTRWGGGPYRT